MPTEDEAVQPTRWERITDWLHQARWRFSIWPSLQIKMSTPWKRMRHLFRKDCGASVLCTFGRKPYLPGGPIYYVFTCRLKRWHKGPCREDALMGWSCGPTVHTPGVIPWGEVNREKFDVLRRAATKDEPPIVRQVLKTGVVNANGDMIAPGAIQPKAKP